MSEDGEMVETDVDVSLDEDDESLFPPPPPPPPPPISLPDVATVRRPTQPSPVSSQVRSGILVEFVVFITYVVVAPKSHQNRQYHCGLPQWKGSSQR